MTLNQKYKASGSSLSFKDWLELQKTLGLVEPKNDVVQERVQQPQQPQQQQTQKLNQEQPNRKVVPSDYNFSVSYEPTNNQKKMFWIVGGLVAIGIGVWAYKKYAKK
jgi:hypothetical protein